MTIKKNKDNKNNTGDFNSGDFNPGNWNSGDYNSGNFNSGDDNSGYWNSGYDNSGDYNSGNRNSGNWNSGDRNSGFFNVDKPKIRIFGKETDIKIEDINFPNYLYFNLIKWINYKDMTEEEKINNSFAQHTKGYLKVYKYKKAFKNSFEQAKLDDIKKTLKLPNFDYKIFEKISGISKKDFDRRLNNKNIKIINGKKYKLVED